MDHDWCLAVMLVVQMKKYKQTINAKFIPVIQQQCKTLDSVSDKIH